MRRIVALSLASVLLGACGSPKKIVTEDFAEGRVIDLSITERLTGNREMLFVSLPKRTRFLEGYIQGIVTDYEDTPVQGVVVRAVVSAEAQVDELDRTSGFAVSAFDPGVSDTNGFYRIRFTLPLLAKEIDVRGRLLYNPGWEQERETLGKAYEPQLKQSNFRLYYNRPKGRLIFAEGIRKSIVSPVISLSGGKAAALPGAKPPVPEKGAGEKKGAGAGGEEDLFKGFGFGQ